MIKKYLICFAALVSFGLAVAQPSFSSSMLSMTSHTQWYEEAQKLVLEGDLNNHVQKLAYSLVSLFLVWAILRAAVTGAVGHLKEIILRLVLVAIILALAGPTKTVLFKTWNDAGQWGIGVVQTKIEEAADEAEEAGTQMPAVASMLAVMEMASTRLTETVSVDDDENSRSTKTNFLINVAASLMFFPMAVYSGVMFLTGLVIVVSLLFLPLAAAFLMTSNGSWMTSWVANNLTAIFIALVLPMIFGIAVEMAVAKPIENLNEFLLESQDHFVASIEEFRVPENNVVWNRKARREWGENLGTSALEVFRGIWSGLIGLISTIIMMIVGLFVSIFLLLQLPVLIASFMGGGNSSLIGGGIKNSMRIGKASVPIAGGAIRSTANRALETRAIKAVEAEIKGRRGK